MSEPRAFAMSLMLAIMVFVPIHFTDFRGTVPHFVRITNGGMIFDRSIAATPTELYRRIERFGAEGRHEYVFRNLTTDFVLPFSMLPLLFLGIARVNRRFGLAKLGRFLLALPVAFVLFDLVENFTVIWLIYRFPEHQDLASTILPAATALKRAAVAGALLVLLGGGAGAAASRLSRYGKLAR